MNYDHAFHAGNFADVVKHAILARVVDYLKKKDTPFRVIDTHAGRGLYDLTSDEAIRSPEWQNGIARLLGAARDGTLEGKARELLAPYLDALASFNPDGGLRHYPGSPALVRAWLRRADRLIACELEPRTAKTLNRHLHGDNRVKTIAIDGWMALPAYIPPPERRGLVLIDPPFEQPNELPRLAGMLEKAWKKWPGGIYLAWYPIKNAKETDAFGRALARTGIEKMLRAELLMEAPAAEPRLRGSGQIIINPPWTLEAELKTLLPALQKCFGNAPGARTRIDWLRADAG